MIEILEFERFVAGVYCPIIGGKSSLPWERCWGDSLATVQIPHREK